MLEELHSQVRRIWTDGRKPPEDMDPAFNGFSSGHWASDTLEIDTVNLCADTAFDATGAFHSDKMTIHERIRLLARGKMEDQSRSGPAACAPAPAWWRSARPDRPGCWWSSGSPPGRYRGASARA